MSDQRPLVSVTVSTFNVEEFVAQSLETIVNQSLKDIEIICIDDGSSDRTLEILYEFAMKDSRMTVVAKKQNEGLAVARNKALTLARGKYISFVDSDDLYDKDLFSKAYKCAEKNDSDMVLWDYVVFKNANEIEAKKRAPSPLLYVSEDDKIALLQRPAFTCVKLIKTEVARKININFPKGLTRQDIPVHWRLVTQLDKISLLPERLFYYRQQPHATTQKKDQKLFDLATVMDITQKYLIESNLYETYKDEFLRQQLNLLFGMYDSVIDYLKHEALKKLNERMGEDQWNYINSRKPMRKQARDFYLSLNGSVTAKLRYHGWLLKRSVYRGVKKMYSRVTKQS
ncbi:MAG: glycosyltransferase family 2 protein [Ginsengibacter sp.]